MYSWITLLLLITIIYMLLLIKKLRFAKNLRHLPSHSYLAVVGNMHLLLGDGKSLFRLLNDISIRTSETDLPFIMWMGITPMIAVSDPEDGKMLLSASVEKSDMYNCTKIWLGDGMATAPGHIWKKKIKMLGGTFSNAVVNSYQDTFNEQAKKLVARLRAHVDGEPFDAMPLIASTTLECICQTALGVSNISNIISVEECYKAINISLKKILEREFNILYHPDFIYKLTRAYKELKQNVDMLGNISEIIIKTREQKQEAEKLTNKSRDFTDDRNEYSGVEYKTYLDILLDMNLSEVELKSEVNTIILAGQETMTTELFFTFLVIGSRKDVQDKLYNEMQGIFGDSKRDVLKGDLDRMVYCEAVINEALRLYPAAPFILRKVERDFKIKSCTVPKGATCLFSMWGSGRSKRLWGPDALEFNPERWSHATPTLTAFSLGRRACIGKRFAIKLMKTVLAYCIRELVFESNAKKMMLKVDLVLKAYEGNLIQIQLRD